ncbi:MAG TPA: hypothetical protein DD473_17535 [Planctomycetaceae bacterium]|nr:hypothetical protein [Planctomycetaceae bacterium]
MALPDYFPEITQASRIAVSFRGYNITNAGQTAALLKHSLLGPLLHDRLQQADILCADALGIKTTLQKDLELNRPSDLSTYSQDLAMIVAVELAHWDAMLEVLGDRRKQIRVLTGYSLGEITATIVSGLFDYEHAMGPVLELSRDAAELAPNVTMGVLFSRGPELDLELIRQQCEVITCQGNGVLAISTYLAPNTVLLMGEGNTVDRFKETMQADFPKTTHLRKNPNHWPPLHTPIVLQKHLRDRAAVMLQTSACCTELPDYPILSCVTGDIAYNGHNSRQLITDWVDHPQQLWKCVHAILEMGIDSLIHLGPEPNILPATLTRISENVQAQLNQPNWYGYGLRTLSKWTAHRRWLAQMMTRDAVLMRAPYVTQVNLEDHFLAVEKS